jgi:predicted nuclease of predicted toxin-antitoxin system
MKLLFDQNISFRIVGKIESLFPGSEQTKKLNLDKSSDITIWEYAKRNNFCIITFDSDFIDISVLKGFPPKIIWLRMGNTSTNTIAQFLIDNESVINDFLISPDSAYLELI